MKKTLIASAVAAAALTTNAFAMDNATDIAERLDMMPTFYGNIQLINTTTDLTNRDASGTYVANADEEDSDFGDNGSTFGIKHDHEIASGLTGFFKAEFEFDADDKGASSGLSGLDEAFIGVKGDFGSVQFGTDDTVAEDYDVNDIAENTGLRTASFVGMDEGDNVQFRTADMDGLSAGITQKLGNNAAVNTSISAGYSDDMFSAAASYAIASGNGEDGFGLGGTVSVDDMTLLASYESQDDASYIGLGAMYSFGKVTLAAQYGMGEKQNKDEMSDYFLHASYSISENMYTYVEYVSHTDELDNGAPDAEISIASIGAAYSF